MSGLAFSMALFSSLSPSQCQLIFYNVDIRPCQSWSLLGWDPEHRWRPSHMLLLPCTHLGRCQDFCPAIRNALCLAASWSCRPLMHCSSNKQSPFPESRCVHATCGTSCPHHKSACPASICLCICKRNGQRCAYHTADMQMLATSRLGIHTYSGLCKR